MRKKFFTALTTATAMWLAALPLLAVPTTSVASRTCTQAVQHGGFQALKNTCGREITLVYCGVGPNGNSSLDCNRRKLAMTGVRAGGIVTVEDRYGGYRSVHWFECEDGSTPSNTGWDGNRVVGTCR